MEDTTTVTESLEEELSCPLCLDIYKDPVSLSCGHTFCQECVQKVISAHQQKRWETYSFLPCDFSQKGHILCPKHGKVFSAFCQNDLTCICVTCHITSYHKGHHIISLKEASHLSKHNARATQRNHVLVEPSTGKSLEERRCSEHSKLVECYCVDDLACICVLCYIAGSHKGHNIITLKEAWDKELVRSKFRESGVF
uniref:Uncharacterized protein n=1 Tax=Crocodylus porosus TaxID=8502 RepID=A0A7M4EI00_CROPO